MATWMAFVRRGGAGLGAALLMAAVPAVPASATPGPALTYSATLSLSCVVAPTVLADEGTWSLGVTGQAPAYVETGDSFGLQDATTTLTSPSGGASFVATSEYAAGLVQSLPLDASAATPTTVNEARQPPWSTLDVEELGPGIPFGPVFSGSSAAITLTAPVATTPEVDTVSDAPTSIDYDEPNGTPATLSVGPFTVTGAAGGASALSLDAAPAYTVSDDGDYTVTGDGTIFDAEAFGPPISGDLATLDPSPAGNRVAGPLATYCNAPTGNVLASVPIVAPAAITTNPPRSISGPAGGTATITAAVSGTPAPALQWQMSSDGGSTWSNDTTDPGNTTDSLTISVPATAPTTPLEYRLQATNSVANTAGAPPAGSGYSSPYPIATVDSTASTLAVAAGTGTVPVVMRVLPNSGGAFSVVLIGGANLGSARTVDFGSRPSLFLPLGRTVIVALAPPAPAGTVDVTVRTRSGTSATSSADRFTYDSVRLDR